MMDTLVDWFGKDFMIIEKSDEEITISVRCNDKALFYWALQYGETVEVLKPESLRNKLQKSIEAMSKKYERKEN